MSSIVSITQARTRSTVVYVPPLVHLLIKSPLNSDFIKSWVESANVFLRHGTRETARLIYKEYDKLKDYVKSLDSLNGVEALVKAEKLHNSLQQIRAALHMIGNNTVVDNLPMDVAGISQLVKQVLQSQTLCAQAKILREEEAVNFMNALQLYLDNYSHDKERSEVIGLLKTVSDRASALPSIVELENVSQNPTPFASGGFSDVFRASYEHGTVALKCLRITDKSKNVLQRYRMEVLTWRQLRHKNVLEFLGTSKATPLSIVLPFLPKGSIRKYLDSQEERNNYGYLFGEIAQGIEYLHTFQPPLVHGDLRGENILITDDGVPKIADMGLAKFLHNVQRTGSLETYGGSIRWMAPELLRGDRAPLNICQPTLESDIYALGMTLYELLLLRDPFGPAPLAISLIEPITKGKRPSLKEISDSPHHPYINIVKPCWEHDPIRRPNIQRVLKLMNDIANKELNQGAGGPPLRKRATRRFIVASSEVKTILSSHQKSIKADLNVHLITRKTKNIDGECSDVFLEGESEHNVVEAMRRIRNAYVKRVERAERTLTVPTHFRLESDLIDHRYRQSSIQKWHQVKISSSDSKVGVEGPRGFVEGAVKDIRLAIKHFVKRYPLMKITISTKAAKRILEATEADDYHTRKLQDGADLHLKISEEGIVSLWGISYLVGATKSRIETLARAIDNEVVIYLPVESGAVDGIRAVMVKIVRECGGPLDPDQFDRLVSIPPPDSPSSAIKIVGEHSLLDRIKKVYERRSWYEDMEIMEIQEVAAYNIRPLMRASVHGLEMFEEICAKGKVEFRILSEMPSAAVQGEINEKTGSPKCELQWIELRGPRRAVKSVHEELKIRINNLTKNTHIITFPLNLKRRLQAMKLAENLEPLGVFTQEDRNHKTKDGVLVGALFLTGKDEATWQTGFNWLSNVIVKMEAGIQR